MPLGSGIEKTKRTWFQGEVGSSRVIRFQKARMQDTSWVLCLGALISSFVLPTPQQTGRCPPTHLRYPFARMKSDNHAALRNIMFTEFFYILQIQEESTIILTRIYMSSLAVEASELSLSSDQGSIPGSGRSPGEGNDNPLQCSCLENPMDRGAWQATVHGVAKRRTRLSDFTFTFSEEELNTYSNKYGHNRASRVALVVKNPPANAEDVRKAGSIPGSGRSPGEGHGKPLQYPCLENPMSRGAWRTTVHSVAKSQTRMK